MIGRVANAADTNASVVDKRPDLRNPSTLSTYKNISERSNVDDAASTHSSTLPPWPATVAAAIAAAPTHMPIVEVSTTRTGSRTSSNTAAADSADA